MILACLLLLTGLLISAVAIYYSVVGLAAIFSAAIIPIIVMGTSLEVAKLVCASWLKANWERAPALMKLYMTVAVIVLMMITSMGIFGFLSKAHSDQSLVSSNIASKIVVYDEKIKTERENIEANRKALKQMDATIDETIARSKGEQGAANANAMRQKQAKERTQIQSDIAKSQTVIAGLNDQRAPIAAEIRKVEAEVGPLKYIAGFIYGETSEGILERAVTWVIISIIVVFDPLAIIMLLAAQMTFGWRKKKEPEVVTAPIETAKIEPTYPKDDGPLTNDQIEQIKTHAQTHTEPVPSETPLTALGGDITAPEEPVGKVSTESELTKWNKMIEQAEQEVAKEKNALSVLAKTYQPSETGYTKVTEDRIKPDLTEVIETELSNLKKKTYMTKDPTGKIQIKDREV